jgi:hypothetical protein
MTFNAALDQTAVASVLGTQLLAQKQTLQRCRADVDIRDGTDASQLGAIDMLHGLGR